MDVFVFAMSSVSFVPFRLLIAGIPLANERIIDMRRQTADWSLFEEKVRQAPRFRVR
jgi:hypothetical protein